MSAPPLELPGGSTDKARESFESKRACLMESALHLDIHTGTRISQLSYL